MVNLTELCFYLLCDKQVKGILIYDLDPLFAELYVYLELIGCGF